MIGMGHGEGCWVGGRITGLIVLKKKKQFYGILRLRYMTTKRNVRYQ